MPAEPHDHHQYFGVELYPDSMNFFIQAMRFYAKRLKDDIVRLQKDEELALFLNPDKVASPLQKEIERAERAANWLEVSWDKDENGFGANITLSHGAVRFLKSVGSSYLNVLRARRHTLVQRITAEAVRTEIDRRIERAAEILSIGVFANATTVPLMANEAEAAAVSPGVEEPATKPGLTKPPPVMVGKIDILDGALNTRCLDLFGMFNQESQEDRFDTVVMEATKILEDRLRKAANLDTSYDGLKLVGAALGGTTPLLRLSEHASEQEGAQALFRGVVGVFRNPFHHKLVGTLAPQRIMQILGTIDYLLHLLESAEKKQVSTTPSP
jgi:uncharacterized protein (TIGR02391 family)